MRSRRALAAPVIPGGFEQFGIVRTFSCWEKRWGGLPLEPLSPTGAGCKTLTANRSLGHITTFGGTAELCSRDGGLQALLSGQHGWSGLFQTGHLPLQLQHPESGQFATAGSLALEFDSF